jgi:hypothetical protein
MTEVLTKCLVREMSGVYRKFYEFIKIPLLIFMVYIAVLIAGCTAWAICYVFNMVVWSRREAIWLFISPVIQPIIDVIVNSVIYITALPLWITAAITAVMVFVVIPVGYCYIKCLKRDYKPDQTEMM